MSGDADRWADLDSDHWENQALAAATRVPEDGDVPLVFGSASRNPDTGEFCYVRLSRRNAQELADNLALVLATSPRAHLEAVPSGPPE